MWNDVRSTLRSMLRTPVFTIVAVLSLALGIGANTAIFSILDQALLRPLPVKDPDGLVLFNAGSLRLPGRSSSDNHETVFSNAMLKDFSARGDVFAGVIARAGLPLVILQTDRPEFATVEMVSGNYYDVLGVRAQIGRAFTSDDDRVPGGHPVVLLSHGAWMTRFGGDASVVNRTVRLKGYPFIIVGVLPKTFQSVVRGNVPELAVPLSMQATLYPSFDGAKDRKTRWLNILARRANGVSPQAAEDAIQSTWRGILDIELRTARSREREEFRNLRLKLEPAPSGINSLKRSLETPLTVLMVTVGIVLLIACINVAGLMIARAAARQRETAIRLSLGAGRWRVVRQCLTESVLLASFGTVLGLLGAGWFFDALLRYADLPPKALSWQIDVRMQAFTALVLVGAGLLSGLTPALQSIRSDTADVLKNQALTVMGGRGTARVRKMLVAAQVTLATVLLISAGLFSRSLWNLIHVDPRLRAEGVMTLQLDLRSAGYNRVRQDEAHRVLLNRLGQLPGVASVGAAGAR